MEPFVIQRSALLLWGWQLKNFEVAASKFNLEHFLTLMASKTALLNILKVASNQCICSKDWWELWIVGRDRKKPKVLSSEECSLVPCLYVFRYLCQTLWLVEKKDTEKSNRKMSGNAKCGWWQLWPQNCIVLCIMVVNIIIIIARYSSSNTHRATSDCMIAVYVSKFGFAFFALNTLACYQSKLSFFHGTKNMHSCFQQGRRSSVLECIC